LKTPVKFVGKRAKSPDFHSRCFATLYIVFTFERTVSTYEYLILSFYLVSTIATEGLSEGIVKTHNLSAFV